MIVRVNGGFERAPRNQFSDEVAIGLQACSGLPGSTFRHVQVSQMYLRLSSSINRL